MLGWKRLSNLLIPLLISVISIGLITIQAQAEGTLAKSCLTECSPRMGVVSAFSDEADILLAEASNKRSYRINGNTFTTGNLRGNAVVIVLTGVSIENGAMLTQLMIDHFNVHHLLLSGIAGGVNPDFHIGDVVIPQSWALPLEGYWSNDSQAPNPCGKPGDISCLGMKLSTVTSTTNSDYQIPASNGAVGTGLFMRETFVRTRSNYPAGEYKFAYMADPKMLAIAQSLRPKLASCGPKNPSLCVSTPPVLRVGGTGVTIPTFLSNPDYRSYLYKTTQAVVADMETAAFAHVAYANEIPFIAFRSLSDLAGGTQTMEVSAFFNSGLAETNEANVTLSFLQAWKQTMK